VVTIRGHQAEDLLHRFLLHDKFSIAAVDALLHCTTTTTTTTP
jgi:hypothetical protein